MRFKDMNLPNRLTTIRMFCVPVMIGCFILYMLSIYAHLPCDVKLYHDFTLLHLIMAVLFVLASITDFIDGNIARKRNLVTDYGKLMDPLADKLLVNTTLIGMLTTHMFLKENQSLIYLEIIAIIMAIIVIARDIFVDALRMQALKKNAVIAASIWGKAKTATLMPGIVFMLVGNLHISLFVSGLVFISLGGIFALIGLIKYYREIAKYIGE